MPNTLEPAHQWNETVELKAYGIHSILFHVWNRNMTGHGKFSERLKRPDKVMHSTVGTTIVCLAIHSSKGPTPVPPPHSPRQKCSFRKRDSPHTSCMPSQPPVSGVHFLTSPPHSMEFPSKTTPSCSGGTTSPFHASGVLSSLGKKGYTLHSVRKRMSRSQQVKSSIPDQPLLALFSPFWGHHDAFIHLTRAQQSNLTISLSDLVDAMPYARHFLSCTPGRRRNLIKMG